MFLNKTRQIQKHAEGVKHRLTVKAFQDIDYAFRSKTTRKKAIQELERQSCFSSQSAYIRSCV